MDPVCKSAEPSETCFSGVGLEALSVFVAGCSGSADACSSSRGAEAVPGSPDGAAGFVTGFSVDSMAGERG